VSVNWELVNEADPGIREYKGIQIGGQGTLVNDDSLVNADQLLTIHKAARI